MCAAIRPGRAVITKIVSASRIASSIECVTRIAVVLAGFHQPRQLFLQDKPSLRVERAERLIEQQDLRLHHKGAGKPDPLAHATRQLTRIPVFKAVEIDRSNRASRPRIPFAFCDASQIETKGDIVDDR